MNGTARGGPAGPRERPALQRRPGRAGRCSLCDAEAETRVGDGRPAVVGSPTNRAHGRRRQSLLSHIPNASQFPGSRPHGEIHVRCGPPAARSDSFIQPTGCQAQV